MCHWMCCTAYHIQVHLSFVCICQKKLQNMHNNTCMCINMCQHPFCVEICVWRHMHVCVPCPNGCVLVNRPQAHRGTELMSLYLALFHHNNTPSWHVTYLPVNTHPDKHTHHLDRINSDPHLSQIKNVNSFSCLIWFSSLVFVILSNCMHWWGTRVKNVHIPIHLTIWHKDSHHLPVGFAYIQAMCTNTDWHTVCKGRVCTTH